MQFLQLFWVSAVLAHVILDMTTESSHQSPAIELSIALSTVTKLPELTELESYHA